MTAATDRAGVWARRPTSVSLGLAGAAVGLIVASRPLATGEPGPGGLTTATRLSATGSGLAPAYTALLLVAAAAAVALAFAGRRLRVVVAGLLALSGVGAELAWRAGLGDAATGLSRSTVPPGLPVRDVSVAAIAWLGDVAAVVVVVAAALALLFGSRWADGARRYDAPAGPAGATSPPGPGAPPASASGASDTTAPSHRGGPADRRSDDEWDALSRGEDPTV